MASGPFTLAQLADAVGTTVAVLRSYQAGRLLQPPRRSRGRSGDKAYHREHVDRLRLVRRAPDFGFTLEDIARLVDTGALVTCGDVHDLAMRRLQAMRDEQGRAAPAVIALESLIAKCTGGPRTDCHVLAVLAGETPAAATGKRRSAR